MIILQSGPVRPGWQIAGKYGVGKLQTPSLRHGLLAPQMVFNDSQNRPVYSSGQAHSAIPGMFEKQLPRIHGLVEHTSIDDSQSLPVKPILHLHSKQSYIDDTQTPWPAVHGLLSHGLLISSHLVPLKPVLHMQDGILVKKEQLFLNIHSFYSWVVN